MDQKLTKDRINELKKEFLSKSVNIGEYKSECHKSDMDTDGSTKGSTSMKSNKQFLDQFPEIAKKYDQLKSNSKSCFATNEKKKKKRRSSFTFIPVYEDLAQEQDLEEIEEDDEKKFILPHIKLVKDLQEFSNSIDHLIHGNSNRNKKTRGRTYSIDKLPNVPEVEEQEDKDIQHSKLENLLDLNEFNQGTPTAIRRVKTMQVSMNLSSGNETIQEDYESEKIQQQEDSKKKQNKLRESSGSPRFQLKYDELDQKKESVQYEQEEDNIEPIAEEREEIDQTDAEKIFEHTIEKLHKEQNYLRKMDQQVGQEDVNMKLEPISESMQKINEIEDSSEEDNTKDKQLKQ